jgi:hypothetical protein
MQRGVDGGVDEVASIACELRRGHDRHQTLVDNNLNPKPLLNPDLHIGYRPLCTLSLHCLDWPEGSAGAAAEGQQRDAVGRRGGMGG